MFGIIADDDQVKDDQANSAGAVAEPRCVEGAGREARSRSEVRERAPSSSD